VAKRKSYNCNVSPELLQDAHGMEVEWLEAHIDIDGPDSGRAYACPDRPIGG